jgi:hypothetical protein
LQLNNLHEAFVVLLEFLIGFESLLGGGLGFGFFFIEAGGARAIGGLALLSFLCRLNTVSQNTGRFKQGNEFLDMNASGLVVVFAWLHENLCVVAEVEISEFSVFVEHDAIVLENKVGVQAGEDVRGEVFSQFKNHLVLHGLDGDLAVVEVDDRNVAVLLCLVAAIVTGSSVLGKHVQSGAFDLFGGGGAVLVGDTSSLGCRLLVTHVWAKSRLWISLIMNGFVGVRCCWFSSQV